MCVCVCVSEWVSRCVRILNTKLQVVLYMHIILSTTHIHTVFIMSQYLLALVINYIMNTCVFSFSFFIQVQVGTTGICIVPVLNNLSFINTSTTVLPVWYSTVMIQCSTLMLLYLYDLQSVHFIHTVYRYL